MHVALDRQAQTGHRRKPRGVAGDREPDLSGADRAARRLDGGDAPVADDEAGHLAILDDVDAAPVGGPGVAPDDCVVARRAAAALQQAAVDRKPRIVVIEERQHRPDLTAVEQFRVDAVKPHGVAAAGEGVTLRVGVIEIDHAALADHHVVIEVALQPLPKLHRPFVELDVRRQEIVRADDGGVAAGIARADPSLFENGDVGQAVLLGEIVGGRQAMTAAADDDHIVFALRLRIAPCRRPA